jgi:hypothetical protein
LINGLDFMKKLPKACYLLLFTLICCKKPYAPPVITGNGNYLVVEGTISAGSDSTIIKLSRTVPVGTSVVANPELHASVTVVSDANATYPLAETGKGYYAMPPITLSASAKYSLKIVTSNGKIYQSDFLTVKNSPPIDSVYYTVQSKGVQINVNTHDPANNTTYYRWSFVETYIIHAYYETVYELQTVPFDTVVLRKPEDQIYECWPSDSSTTIILGSSAKLKQDVISQKEMTSIPYTSEKIADRYSILVKQYALTQDAYNYWQLLKTNTEQLGSIFDAEPSQLPGNIHCVSTPSEPVIGYLSAGSASQFRIYLDSRTLPALQPILPVSTDGCVKLTFVFKDQDNINQVIPWIYSGNQWVIETIPKSPMPGQAILGYVATDRFCVDCTLRGPNKPPAFWKN